MMLLGYIAAILIGLTMGLVGGGGSILIIPVLVYLFNIEPLAATSYSFFIVGVASLIGAGLKIKQDVVDLRMALLFGIPDIIGVITMRTYIFPPIPGDLFLIGQHLVTKGEFVMILFSVIMLFSAVHLIKKNTPGAEAINTLQQHKPLWFFILIGLLTGWLTGMVGVGGGFLIVPVLVLWAGLPMKKAVGTSLVIIAAKSLVGFFADRIHYHIDYTLTLLLCGLAIVGLLIGNYLSHKISARRIQFYFGWFVFFLGLYMLYNEITN